MRARSVVAWLVVGACALSPLTAPSASAATASPDTSSSAPRAAADVAPEDRQQVVFDNARLALRDGRPKDALLLWMLRNALIEQGQPPSAHDADFRSVVWAALGETLLCPDGFIDDDKGDEQGGAGLWPLAVHNWLVKTAGRQAPSDTPLAWLGFSAGAHQRPFSLFDVLSAEELKAARFTRSTCLTHLLVAPRLPTLQWIDLDDRLKVGLMMRDLLELSLVTLDGDKVTGRALLTSRRFDLDAALTRLALSRATSEAGVLAEAARVAGLADGSVAALRKQRLGEFRSSAAAVVWRKSMTWPAHEWLALNMERRLALFGDAQAGLADADDAHSQVASDRIVVDVIDALLEKKAGLEIAGWLGFARAEQRPLLYGGARGERLLGLSPESGFRERSALALHRGVDALRAGDTLAALRSFAFALGHASESQDAAAVHSLSRRWLAFTLSQYETDEAVLSVLQEFVAPADFNSVVEMLVWRAALHADSASFERVAARIRPKSALAATVDRLRPLSRGDPTSMWTQASLDWRESPSRLSLFAEQLVEHLALETLDVRSNNKATLALADDALAAALAATDVTASASVTKKIGRVRVRLQALLEGVGTYDTSVQGRAAAQAPDRESYAGSVRLAPADPLPWPFPRPQAKAPSPFSPVRLVPVEWRVRGGPLVYGWSLQE